MKILITAFEPFDDNEINYSKEVLERLDNKVGINKEILPVEYNGSFTKMKEYIENYSPTHVIMLGEARKYPGVRFETIASNELGDKPDNSNFVPTSRFINEGASCRIFANLDFDLFLDSFKETGIEVFKSFNAGNYVCNSLFYQTMEYLLEKDPSIKCGFIHIPDLTKYDINGVVEGLDNFTDKTIK